MDAPIAMSNAALTEFFRTINGKIDKLMTMVVDLDAKVTKLDKKKDHREKGAHGHGQTQTNGQVESETDALVAPPVHGGGKKAKHAAAAAAAAAASAGAAGDEPAGELEGSARGRGRHAKGGNKAEEPVAKKAKGQAEAAKEDGAGGTKDKEEGAGTADPDDMDEPEKVQATGRRGRPAKGAKKAPK